MGSRVAAFKVKTTFSGHDPELGCVGGGPLSAEVLWKEQVIHGKGEAGGLVKILAARSLPPCHAL